MVLKILKSNKGARIPFLITAHAFLFGGIDTLENGTIYVAAVHFSMALLNFGAALIVTRHPHRTNIILFILNAVFASFLSYTFFRAGNRGMHYAWALISLVSLAACIIYSLKARRSQD